MIAFVLRVLYTVAGLTPMAFGLLCRDANSVETLAVGVGESVIIVTVGVAVLRFAFWWIKTGFGIPVGKVVPVAVNRYRGGLPAYILAYILPFFLASGIYGTAVVLAILLISVFSLRKSSLGYNPLADMLGFGFFEVGLAARGGVVSVFVVSELSLLELTEGFSPVRFSEDCYLVFRGD